MRLTLIAAALLLGSIAPSFADDAADLAAAKATIAAAKLSPASDLAMWCGAAFTLGAATLTQSGDATQAKTYSDKADVLFGKASPLLTADGVPAANMGPMSTAYMSVAFAQTMAKTEPAAHSQDDCEAAAK